MEADHLAVSFMGSFGDAKMSNKGPKPDPRREHWRKAMKMTPKQVARLTYYMLDRLDRCQSPEAQRLIIRGLPGYPK